MPAYAKASVGQDFLPEGQEIAGASDGIQTRDLRLGKATLYQLSYTRAWDLEPSRALGLFQVSLAFQGRSRAVGPGEIIDGST